MQMPAREPFDITQNDKHLTKSAAESKQTANNRYSLQMLNQSMQNSTS